MKNIKKPIEQLKQTDIIVLDFINGRFRLETFNGVYYPNRPQTKRLFELNPGNFTARAADSLAKQKPQRD